MKHFLNLVDNSIDTSLEYKEAAELIVTLDTSCNLDILINNFTKKIKLLIKPNIKVNVTQDVMSNDATIDLEYYIENGAFLNEFVFIDKDNIDVVYKKNVQVLENSTYEVSNAFFNDSSVDFNVLVNLDGINARALHNIAAISRFNHIKNFDIRINNNSKMSYGELNNFGVVKNEATLNFNGIGYIKQGAAQSQAHQESKIITFDPKVKAQANPYLIIDEADVEASHAAAVGKMDEEQLFYMQSRGINSDEASQLITYGYLKPVLKKIENDDLREKLENLIEIKVVS